MLHEDGRSSYSDISKVIGVSAGTVRNRISRMRSSGMLHFDVWLDPYRSGLGVHATLLMKIQPGQLAEAADALAALEETGYVATLAGAYDIVADVFCRGVPDLSLLIHDKAKSSSGLQKRFLSRSRRSRACSTCPPISSPSTSINQR